MHCILRVHGGGTSDRSVVAVRISGLHLDLEGYGFLLGMFRARVGLRVGLRTGDGGDLKDRDGLGGKVHIHRFFGLPPTTPYMGWGKINRPLWLEHKSQAEMKLSIEDEAAQLSPWVLARGVSTGGAPPRNNISISTSTVSRVGEPLRLRHWSAPEARTCAGIRLGFPILDRNKPCYDRIGTCGAYISQARWPYPEHFCTPRTPSDKYPLLETLGSQTSVQSGIESR